MEVACQGRPGIEVSADLREMGCRMPWEVRVAFDASGLSVADCAAEDTHNINEAVRVRLDGWSGVCAGSGEEGGLGRMASNE